MGVCLVTVGGSGCGDDCEKMPSCEETCTDDGLFCNGTESCNVDTGACEHSGNPCTGADFCVEADDQCCVPNIAVTDPACNADGDVTAFDSCGYEMVIEDCGDAHGTCHEARCGCEEGYGGDDCSCVIFVDGEIASSGDGSTWENAFQTVQEGIDAAAANPGGCAVWVKGAPAPGLTYAERIIISDDVHLYGGFAGDESDFVSRDPAAFKVVLDGEANGAVVTYQGHVEEVNHAILDSLVITGGSNSGLRILDASPTVSDCIFDANVSQNGGGVFLFGGSPRFIRCTFSQNSTVEGADGVGAPNDSNHIDGGHGGHGGGMYITTGSPTLIGCIFSDNHTGSGGDGVDGNYGFGGWGTGNGGDGGNGAGVYVNLGTPMFIDCVFSGNTCGSAGTGGDAPDAMAVVDGGDGGDGGQGGGVYVDTGLPTLVGCTLQGNSAGAGNTGGEGNLAGPAGNGRPGQNGANGNGGGVFNGGSSCTLTNCLLWGNTSSVSGQEQLGGISSQVTYSDIQDGYAGDGNIDADPLFVDAPAGNLRLGPGSPCIDTGNTAALPSDLTDLDRDGDTAEPLPFDLDGNPRVQGTAVDMGAYEVQ